MSTMKEKHTFVICAYKESAYLEECVKSLKEQKKESNIIMVTSTPNDYIKNICEKYDVELKINHGQGGIVQDWNFGYNQARTPYVTIAHQDDLYFSDYSIRAVRKLEESKHPLIYFSDYCEIRNGETKSYEMNPEDYGISICKKSDLEGGDGTENAQITKDILSGKLQGAKRDAVLLNAGACIYVQNDHLTYEEAINIARETIDSGKAYEKLQAYIEESNK